MIFKTIRNQLIVGMSGPVCRQAGSNQRPLRLERSALAGSDASEYIPMGY